MSLLKPLLRHRPRTLYRLCSTSPVNSNSDNKNKTSFVSFLKNEEESLKADTSDNGNKDATFASLMRNCRWTAMGDPKGKVVLGRVYHIVNDDMYVDIGHKFPVIVQRPRRRRATFQRGSKVRILLNSLELSKKFLGYDREMTLCEADGTLLGLHEMPSTKTQ